MRINLFLNILLITALYLLLLAGCDPGGNDPKETDTENPTASVAPPDGSAISATASFIITFSEAMSQNTLILSGTLSDECDVPDWNENSDTLTISPITTWPEDAGNLIINCKDMAGNSLETIELNYTIDITPPDASLLYPDNSGIPHTSPIIIYFNDEMDPDTFILTITPSGMEGDVSWSASSTINDTVTITPSTTWSSSPAQFTIDCNDKAGNPVSQINVSYYILYGIFYVRTDGNDLNPGTSDLPKLTIRAAIEAADQLYEIAEVHVAQGSYEVSYQSSTHIILAEGISLYGGYNNSNWDDRNSAAYSTTIIDTSTTGGSLSYPNCAVDGSGITTATIIDGFTIDGAGGDYSSGICLKNSASPGIQNNIINGGSGSSSSYGIYIYSINGASLCSPVIQNNTINGGTSDGYSVGIRSYYSSPVIQYNPEITGGTGAVSSYGIYNYYNSAPLIQNNITIDGGNGNYSYAVYNDESDPVIQNNTTIDGGDGITRSYGVYSRDMSEATITGNDLITGGTGSVLSYAVYTIIDTISTIQNNTEINGGSGDSSYGIYNEEYSIIEDNDLINGGDGTAASYGIYNNNTHSRIMSNSIEGGSGDSGYAIYHSSDTSNATTIANNSIDGGSGSSATYGVFIQFCSSPFVYNNIITGGNGNNSYGIFNESSNTRIRNNTIDNDSGLTNAYCIYLYENSATDSHPFIDNNILYTTSSGNNVCIVEDYDPSRSCEPNSLRNNNFYGAAGHTLYYDKNTDESISDIADINLKSIASANVNVDPLFSTNYYLSPSTPSSVTTGGLNGSHSTEAWGFTTDKDESNRSPIDDSAAIGWSMGAYEY